MIACLRREHREIESRLDRFAAALESGDNQAAHAVFLEAWPLAREHYCREEGAFFAAVRQHLPALAAKMELQHEEAREIAAHLEDPDLPEPEWQSLARRWLAITQHNLIEEERDLFVLAEKRDILKS
ncbi:MAG TPA: hemerythrin domain-containing protein [Bryobacteraceae bacterium]|nr:hemerythrin domain-containing protein [Bryobacteraceae bacterium]